jgi:hypothetical protein
VADLADLETALAAFGIEAGFPSRRRLLAGALLSIGVQPDGVELLGRHCEAHVAGEANAVRVLFALLAGPPDALKDRIADLRACEAARHDRTAAPEFGKAQRARPSDEALAQRAAFARVVADRAPVDVVARELGLSAPEVDALIEQERAERARGAVAPPSARPRPTESEQARRRAEVQQALFERKRMPATKAEQRVVDAARKLPVARSQLLDEIAKTNGIDLRRALQDPAKRGALAELEGDGWIESAGAPDMATGRQPFRVVYDEKEREGLKAARRLWQQREIQDMSTGSARAAAQSAKARAQEGAA